MKSWFLIFVTASLFFVVIADPSCNFSNDTNNDYYCPLTGGDISAEYNGPVGGLHVSPKGDSDVLSVIADEAVSEFILKKLFDRFVNLKILEFRKGIVSALSKEYFYNCNKLEKVLIRAGVFSKVPDNIFGNCTALKEIDFGNNHIDDIERIAFTGLESLEILKLDDNILQALQPSVLSPLQKLKTLDLSKNQIKIFDADAFSNNKELLVLILAENKIERLVVEYFDDLKQLTTLDLQKNLVNETEEEMVKNLVGIKIVKFKENACIDKDFQNFANSDVEEFKICIENNEAPTMIISSFAFVLLLISKLF